MRRNRWIGLAGAIMAWSALAIPAGAQAPGGDLAKLRREFSDLSFEVLRAEAEAAELKDEQRLLTTAIPQSGEADARPLSADEALWKEAVDKAVLHRGSAAQPAALEGLATQRKSIEEDQKTAIAAWSSAMERSLAFQDEISKAEALVGWSWNAAGPPVGVSLGLIALGTLAVLGGLIFTFHEIRDGLRWRLRALGSRPSLIAMAIAMPLAVACGAGPEPKEEAGNPPAVGEETGDLKQPSGCSFDRSSIRSNKPTTPPTRSWPRFCWRPVAPAPRTPSGPRPRFRLRWWNKPSTSKPRSRSSSRRSASRPESTPLRFRKPSESKSSSRMIRLGSRHLFLPAVKKLVTSALPASPPAASSFWPPSSR